MKEGKDKMCKKDDLWIKSFVALNKHRNTIFNCYRNIEIFIEIFKLLFKCLDFYINFWIIIDIFKLLLSFFY